MPQHAVRRPESAAPPARGLGAMRLPALVGAVAALGVGVVGAVDPNSAGHYPTCPFLALTGWWCPGCGSLRAVHALAHGDIGTALARNPFAVVALAGLVVGYAAWVRRRWRGESRTTAAPPWLLHALLAVVLVFWVARNLPGMTWLSPA